MVNLNDVRDEIKEFTYTGDPNNMSDKMDAEMMNLSKKLQLQKIAQEIADLEQQKSIIGKAVWRMRRMDIFD